MNFITSYSTIRNHRISKNGTTLFTGSSDDAPDQFLTAAYEFLNPGYPKFYKMDNLSRLGFLACEVLLNHQQLNNGAAVNTTAVVLSNASASLDNDRKYFKSTLQIASPALFVYTLPNIVAGEICIRHGLKGENGFFIFGQFNAAFITGYVNQVMERGADRCITGWVEVNGREYDGFLYLLEREKRGEALVHTAETVNKIYNQ